MTGTHDHTHSHDHDHSHGDAERWKHDGVRVIPGNQLDPNVPSTAGMDRKAAINFARVGAQKLWAGTVSIHPDAKTGALFLDRPTVLNLALDKPKLPNGLGRDRF